ncbi:cupredoxin domain-containing protein [Cysteiniphilum halobium]|uniref:cupredoxin domain-containing protein n=1 Tax=Cysteiniphilum halobium TaxID=2219059 RepID=UPI000E6574E0|nr:cupredoxin domain-containing protein [Cysteiniphilum halobium]
MITVFVNSFLVIAAFFVVYWFWLSQSKGTKVKSNTKARILVKDGVYSPANLYFNVDNDINLEFIRNDKSACAEIVVFKELNKQYILPMKESFDIALGKLPKGVYHFSCQMNMYQGAIIVE